MRVVAHQDHAECLGAKAVHQAQNALHGGEDASKVHHRLGDRAGVGEHPDVRMKSVVAHDVQESGLALGDRQPARKPQQEQVVVRVKAQVIQCAPSGPQEGSAAGPRVKVDQRFRRSR
jgi:hypothetical protein